MINLFSGIHEVRLLRPNGVATGYFDNFDAALRAVENEPSQYRAGYFSLNPIKLPAEIPVNPQTLSPSHNAAADSDIVRLTRLLVDLDPPRPPNTNSTLAEKQAGREQAEAVRDYLQSRGWPEPILDDSGNSYHLLYRIDLPNEPASTELLKATLARLHQLFPMVDTSNYNAGRVCKLYGSWVRKGEHSAERPWRRSAIVEVGSDTLVTETQLRELVPVVPEVPREQRGNDVKLEVLLGFLSYYSVPVVGDPRQVRGGWQVEVTCPWQQEHSQENRRETVVSFIAGLGYGFKCLHDHCSGRHWKEFRAEMEKCNPGLVPYFGKLPKMTHSAIARQFVEEHDDFVRLYDQDNETGVWLPGVHWALGDKNDALLRMAIRRYLDELYDRYPEPEPGKPDPRRALQQAPFVSGVLAEVKPFLPPKSTRDFDCSPDLLPLPNGLVVELRTAKIRPMRHEDCLTKRIPIMPENVPTPRWERFLAEITLGNETLARYILRLTALAITGLSLHRLIFFYGNGRNGKGVLLRLVEKILGRELFAVAIRPEEVEYHPHGSEDRSKRLMGRMRKMRLVYTGETVNGPLDWTLLKTLTGGDTLSGAKLYEDSTGFAPSHTLILTTNHRPKLPPTMSIKERLRFVPFNANFTNSTDFTLEDDLAAEAPGILWQLIQEAPAAFTKGDEPPKEVQEASADVLDENDIGRPFREQCLIEDPQAVTPIPEIKAAIIKWLGPSLVLLDERVEIILDTIRAQWKYGRKRVEGKDNPVRGLLGVRLRSTS